MHSVEFPFFIGTIVLTEKADSVDHLVASTAQGALDHFHQEMIDKKEDIKEIDEIEVEIEVEKEVETELETEVETEVEIAFAAVLDRPCQAEKGIWVVAEEELVLVLVLVPYQ